MKQFHCGDVVPGCSKRFEAEDEQGVLNQVSVHAREDHNLAEIPAALVMQVRERIQDVKVA